MGLDAASVKLACAAKSLGVDFSNTLTIGRQTFNPERRALQRVFAVHGIDHDAADFLREHRYGEEFFSLLGARRVSSLDFSSYEGATFIHDMNSPVPDSLHREFSVVWDGGSLEHVFDVAAAFRNCMEMVEVGGHFLQMNEANNYMGHGFWQFSPELIFRVFSPDNGFEVEAVLLHEVVPGGAWYLVTDPVAANSRVELCNSVPTYILTIARKVKEVEILAQPPQQSDYVSLWNRDSHAATPGERLRQLIPQPLKRVVKRVRPVLQLFRGTAFKRPYYKRVREDDLLLGRLNPGIGRAT